MRSSSGRSQTPDTGRQLQIGFGDIVWLPEGTALKYIARERVGYSYALYPVDWAPRQGTVEP